MIHSSNVLHCIQQMCERYGANSQIDVCIEEMSELTKALIKARRSKLYSREANFNGLEDIKEELADVYLMLEYIAYIFDIKEPDLARLVEQKALRTIGRYLTDETNTDSK